MRPGFSASATAFKSFATASGSTMAPSGVSMRMPRSAPMARPTRIVSCALAEPMETTTTSAAVPFSLRRTASSTAISSKGFIDIFTLARSIPDPSGFTRILTLKSTTRLTGTNTFMPVGSPSAMLRLADQSSEAVVQRDEVSPCRAESP